MIALLDWTSASEEGFQYHVDKHRFDAGGNDPADRSALVKLATSKRTQQCVDDPEEAEISERGSRVEEAVGARLAPKWIDESIGGVVELFDKPVERHVGEG